MSTDEHAPPALGAAGRAPVIRVPGPDGERNVFELLRPELGEGARVSSKPLSSRTCLIAFLPRSGSTALASLLEATGVLGRPEEYLNARGQRSPLRHWARTYGSRDLVEYLDAIRRERSTPNGIFSLKTAYVDLRPLLESGRVSELLGEPSLVYLTRDDIVAQAISVYVAQESGLWHRDRSGQPYKSRPTEQGQPPYDEARILSALDGLLRTRETWERIFALSGVEPLRISYEDLLADAGAVVGRICSHVEVAWDGDVSLDEAVTIRLADETSREWAERLRSRSRL